MNGAKVGMVNVTKTLKFSKALFARISLVSWANKEFSSLNVLLATPKITFVIISVVYIPEN